MKRVISKKQLQTIKNGDSLYLLGYSLVLLRVFIKSTAIANNLPGWMTGSILIMGYMLIIARVIVRHKIKKKYFYVGLLMASVFMLSLYESGYTVLLNYTICCLFAVGIEFNRIVKLYAIESTILISITVIVAILGLIDNYIYYRSGIGSIRMSMGFAYPTDFAAHIFFVLVAISLLNYDSFNFKWVILFSLISAVSFLVTNARGPCSMMVILAFVIYIYKLYQQKGIQVLPTWLLKYSSVICAVITLSLIRFYNPNNRTWVVINRFTTNRLGYARNIMNSNHIKLLGQFIEQRGDGNGGRSAGIAYTYIDLSFQRILLLYGVLVFVLILIYSVLLNSKALKSQNTVIPLLLFIVSFYCLTAQHYFDFSYNFLLLSYFAIIPTQERLEKGRKRIRLKNIIQKRINFNQLNR